MPDQPSPLRILVIEDEAPIRRFLRIVLEGEGHVMDEAARGREGIKRAAMSAPSAIVLDLGLPDMDGKAVIGVIREWSDIPIVVVSVRSSEAEIVTALDAGADDYVTKPFAPAELLARLRALVRRRGAPEPAPVLAIGDLSIDLTARTVTKAESTVHLTRKEFDVLALLARNAGRLLTHQELLRTVWGPAHLGDSHYLRVAVGHLREKLGDDAAAPRLIFTEPGIGYRFAAAE